MSVEALSLVTTPFDGFQSMFVTSDADTTIP